jgi:hypothetical protein
MTADNRNSHHPRCPPMKAPLAHYRGRRYRAKLIPFPLAQQRPLVVKLAACMAAQVPARAEKLLTELQHRIDALHRQGLSDSAVEHRLERFDLLPAFPDGSIGRLGPIVASHVTAPAANSSLIPPTARNDQSGAKVRPSQWTEEQPNIGPLLRCAVLTCDVRIRGSRANSALLAHRALSPHPKRSRDRALLGRSPWRRSGKAGWSA